jgi:hypothetical protein
MRCKQQLKLTTCRWKRHNLTRWPHNVPVLSPCSAHTAGQVRLYTVPVEKEQCIATGHEAPTHAHACTGPATASTDPRVSTPSPLHATCICAPEQPVGDCQNWALMHPRCRPLATKHRRATSHAVVFARLFPSLDADERRHSTLVLHMQAVPVSLRPAVATSPWPRGLHPSRGSMLNRLADRKVRPGLEAILTTGIIRHQVLHRTAILINLPGTE